MKKSGFTLIELLVVISIIALLLAILMPALSTVKNQAKILVCAANCKQVGTLMALYESDHGSMPTVLSRYTSDRIPAKNTYLSVAFADYVGSSLPANFETDKPWHHGFDTYMQYCEKYLPDFFVCPFTRGKTSGGQIVSAGTTTLTSNSSVTFGLLERNGRTDSYGVWLWPITRGPNCTVTRNGAGVLDVPNHPYGADHGYPEFGVLNFHSAYEKGYTNPNSVSNFNSYKETPVRWGRSQLNRVRASSLASATAIYCEQGEYINIGGSPRYHIQNLDSHKRKGYGGTNVIFGDTHVGWVRGSNIGWP